MFKENEKLQEKVNFIRGEIIFDQGTGRFQFNQPMSDDQKLIYYEDVIDTLMKKLNEDCCILSQLRDEIEQKQEAYEELSMHHKTCRDNLLGATACNSFFSREFMMMEDQYQKVAGGYQEISRCQELMDRMVTASIPLQKMMDQMQKAMSAFSSMADVYFDGRYRLESNLDLPKALAYRDENTERIWNKFEEFRDKYESMELTNHEKDEIVEGEFNES